MEYLLAPQNVVFNAALLVGVILSLAAFMGAGDDADADAAPEMDAEIDVETGGHHGAEHGSWSGILAFFGIGKVSIGQVIAIMTLIFGGAGIIANAVFRDLGFSPALYGWLSFVVASVASILVTGRVAIFIARVIPGTETYGIRKRDLVGRTGSLLTPADARSGIVRVEDGKGDLHQLDCRSRSGELARGTEVDLLDYDPDKDVFTVEKAMPIDV